MSVAIAGRGIGGSTAALSLQAAGFPDIVVLESARALREVGVGIDLPPHAVRELTELGLGDALARAGVLTEQLAYYDRQGRLIWAEARGTRGRVPMAAVFDPSGALQRLLLDAVRERLGERSVRVGARVGAVESLGDGRMRLHPADMMQFDMTQSEITQSDMTRPGAGQRDAGVHTLEVDLLIAADGIRSTIRDQLRGQVTPLASDGWVMYRGTTPAPTSWATRW
jgi:2-polyprenyl-6-methoxyphenol hydroxylase-like FAD-dependent oxidoreductase